MPDRLGTAVTCAARKSRLPAADVPILMYHSISASAAPRFSRFVVHPYEFAAQMHHLAAAGYQILSAGELARRSNLGDFPERSVVLTFDDAYADFDHAVLPVLQEYGFPATLYVPTAYVGRTALWLTSCGEDQRALLSWGALRDVATLGVEVASHTHTHPQLDRVPRTVVTDEVRRSRLMLEDNLGQSVEGFAYPLGYWNPSARSGVSAAGYVYACAVGEIAASTGSDRLTLPRITVNGGLSSAAFAHLLASRSTTGKRLSSDLKRRAWRSLRSHVRSVGGDPREGAASMAASKEPNADIQERRIAR